jgi:hypothetical protein
MTPAELVAFMSTYYRRPEPERAPRALATVAASGWVQDSTSRIPTVYFFARLGRQHPALVPKFRAVLARTPSEGQPFVHEVLAAIAAPTPPTAADRPTGTATDNDLLWVEFSLTGAPEPVAALIDVLDWPDRLRARLGAWLGVQPEGLAGMFVGWRRRWVLRRLAAVLEVDDLDQPDAESSEDLDCRAMLAGLTLSRPRFERVCRILPVTLSADEQMPRLARLVGRGFTRLLQAAGLAGVSRRRHIWTTRRDPAARPAPDLVQRAFAVDGPNRLWVADITYVPTWAGFLYLAVVLDAWSRRVIGWAMPTHLRTDRGPRAPSAWRPGAEPVRRQPGKSWSTSSLIFSSAWMNLSSRPPPSSASYVARPIAFPSR